ncbi:hypothetical protein ACP4OV_002894 [Aristida adscensionis]
MSWIIHQYPRHIELRGIEIKLDAAMCSADIDLRWRHFSEPDFAMIALAGEDPCNVVSIYNQFAGDAVNYNLARTQMIVIPARLIDGWVCYMWDMRRKVIHVLDPGNAMSVDNERRAMHSDLTGVVHRALSELIASFFDDWTISEVPWPRTFPTLALQNFKEVDSGIAALYFTRHYDGNSLEVMLTKDAFEKAQRWMVYDVLKLEGNMGKIPSGAQDAM